MLFKKSLCSPVCGVWNNHSTEMCSGSEAGSYLRLIDSCITQLKAQGPSRTCNESKEEEEEGIDAAPHQPSEQVQTVFVEPSDLHHSCAGFRRGPVEIKGIEREDLVLL